MIRIVLGIILFPLSQQHHQLITKAVVVFNVGNEQSGVHGFLEISQDSPESPVLISGPIYGLQPNTAHGYHVHQSGDIRQGCASVGAHFNPWNQQHGAPWDYHNRHVGDLGNLWSDSNGQVFVNIWDPVISLNGINSIVGRGFVIHEKEDDLGRGGSPESLVNGNAGARISCGIVGIV